jgi:uncharacterized protein (DUF2141 family)
MSHPLKHITVFLLISIFVLSCAQVVAPGGGPKDTFAPKPLKYRPDSAQLNFNAKNIQIDFDEFIQLKDLNNQLIISPPMKKTPEITVKNKTLNITIDKNEELRPNTTYSISFGNSIQDLNENNPLKDFRYLFSTGSFIDSLSLKGKVENAFDLGPQEGILVALYNDMNDSVVFKSQPDYFAKTEKDGSFLIRNIRSGKYKLAAIKDANVNYRYDGEPESIGFADAAVDANEKKEIVIGLFEEPAKKIYLKKYVHDSYGKVSLYFNNGSDSLRVQPLNNDQKGVQEYIQFSKNNDTLVYWFKNFMKDSLILQVSNGNKVIDTLNIRLLKKEDALKSKKNPLKLKVLNSPDGNQSFDMGSELVLRFNHLPAMNKPAPVELKADTVPVKTKNGRLLFIPWNNQEMKLCSVDSSVVVEDPDNPGKFMPAPIATPFTDWKENTTYHLFLQPGAVEDFFGLSNDSIKISFHTREEKYYGSVKVSFPGLKNDVRHIVQLVDEGGKVVREEIISSPELEFNYLQPKKYRLKIIYDTNNNGKWDSGNYLEKEQPEKVIYNSELINIRSNWDAELEWKISE